MASDLGIVCGLTLPLGASAMMSTCRTCGYRRHPSREGSPRRKVGTHVNSFANLMTKPPAARVVAPPPPASIAVSDLEAEVARLRAELAATHATPADQPAKKPRLREDFVPNTVEEAGLWLKSRQQEMDDAIISGNTLDVARLASAIAEGAGQLRVWTQAAIARQRQRRRRRGDDLESRVIRAENLVHVGELSSARQALEGDSVAPGTQATLDKLQDVQRRPPQPREVMPPENVGFQPPTFVSVGREKVREKGGPLG